MRWTVYSDKICKEKYDMRNNCRKKIACTLSALLMIAAFPYVQPGSISATAQIARAESDSIYFHSTFEGDIDEWSGRGSATVMTSGRTAYEGNESLLVQERASAWNGAYRALSTSEFKPGNEYSFSADVQYFDGGQNDTFYMKLQYTDANGDTQYSSIASATAIKGEWVQLANTNYRIPDDADNMQLYIETESSTNNFYIDEAIGAVAGTVIDGPQEITFILGDVNFDGVIDSLDLSEIRLGIVKGFDRDIARRSADVNGDRTVDEADLRIERDFIMGAITQFPEPEITDGVQGDWDNYVETASPEMQKFYSDAIHNMGNTARLRNKIASAQRGEQVKVAYLGGSITEGVGMSQTCYAKRSFDYFADTFGTGGNVSYINAGMSGTSSVVGLMRAQRDILDAEPDVIFIEFSVNDHPEEIYKKAFESLVKKCLMQENEPAVIIIINRSKGGYTSKSQMSAVGKNFNVPVISMDDALTSAFNSGTLKAEDYFSDEYHPHENGSKLIADAIAYYYRQALKTENISEEYTIPEISVYGSEYATGSIVSLSGLSDFSAGSWKTDNSNSRFAYGFTFSKNSENAPMTFSTEGKGIFIVFKSNQNSSLGNLNVTVNGKTSTVKGNRNYAWGGADAEIAYIQNSSDTLNVSLSMENAGTDFTIWGIGVVK
ncbi:MAG: carbohydrate binding domain-containing protein [Ruminococcus sp.]|nr:carbohydrate binding domain-containing protein [Ruminococcus sp.]